MAFLTAISYHKFFFHLNTVSLLQEQVLCTGCLSVGLATSLAWAAGHLLYSVKPAQFTLYSQPNGSCWLKASVSPCEIQWQSQCDKQVWIPVCVDICSRFPRSPLLDVKLSTFGLISSMELHLYLAVHSVTWDGYNKEPMSFQAIPSHICFLYSPGPVPAV